MLIDNRVDMVHGYSNLGRSDMTTRRNNFPESLRQFRCKITIRTAHYLCCLLKYPSDLNREHRAEYAQ